MQHIHIIKKWGKREGEEGTQSTISPIRIKWVSLIEQ